MSFIRKKSEWKTTKRSEIKIGSFTGDFIIRKPPAKRVVGNIMQEYNIEMVSYLNTGELKLVLLDPLLPPQLLQQCETVSSYYVLEKVLGHTTESLENK